MLILVTYDVSTVEKAGQRRLRRVAQACEDYGVRVQKSVFECQVGQMEWVSLRDRLLREIKADEDSLRFYFLDEKAVQRIEHHGVAKPLDLSEPSGSYETSLLPRTPSDGPATGISRRGATAYGRATFNCSLTTEDPSCARGIGRLAKKG